MAEDEFLKTVERYNAQRDLAGRPFYSCCYAPFVSLYFDQLGSVRACCQNTQHTLGNITRQSLDEIWNGAAARELRQALRVNELRKGCHFCEWQFLDGNPTGTFMRRYDVHLAESPEPAFPKLMEFSISNTCNLECVMCNGEWSSSIRTRREKKPPLPKPYGDRFFDELRKYLPHLERANFLGGEPFLERETARIWDMMIEMGLTTRCHITTNGTQYNERVERIIEHLPCDFSISMDGVQPETVEKIRKNARYAEVLENFKRFHAYTRRRGTGISLTFCLMVPNWREFGDYLAFGDDWDCDVCVNVVSHPPSLSLYQLNPSEFAEVVAEFERKDAYYQQRLKRNLPIWNAELTRLRQRLQHVHERSFQAWGYRFRATEDAADRTFTEADVRRLAQEWSGREPVFSLTCGPSDLIEQVESADSAHFSVDSGRLLGQHISAMKDVFCERYGIDSALIQFEQDERRIDIIQTFGQGDHPRVEVRALTLPQYDEEGTLMGTKTWLALRDAGQPSLVAIDLGNSPIPTTSP